MDNILKYIGEHKVLALTGLAVTPIIAYGWLFFKRPRNLPPGPYGYPYYGSSGELSVNLVSDLKRLQQKYGDIFCLWTGGNKYIVVLNSYDIIKEAFITKGNDFVDRIASDNFSRFVIADALFNAPYNEQQRTYKKFAISEIRKFVTNIMDDMIEDELSKFDESIDKANGQPMKLEKYLPLITTSFMMRLLFNKSFDKDTEELTMVSNYTENWVGQVSHIFIGGYFPCKFQDKVDFKEPNNATVVLNNYIKTQIEEHMSSFDPNNTVDMMDAFLKGNAVEELGMERLIQTLMMLLPDGIFTAAIVMQKLLVYLFRHPIHMKAVEDEILKVNDATGSPRITVNDRKNLPFTDCFIHEVLRMESVVPVSGTNKQKVDRVLCGYNIPKCASIVSNYHAAHNDPKYFPEPDKFKPERFFINGKFQMMPGLIPFGVGRRMCPGEHLMKNEIFLIFSNMILKYHMTPDLKQEMDPGQIYDVKLHAEAAVIFTPRS